MTEQNSLKYVKSKFTIKDVLIIVKLFHESFLDGINLNELFKELRDEDGNFKNDSVLTMSETLFDKISSFIEIKDDETNSLSKKGKSVFKILNILTDKDEKYLLELSPNDFIDMLFEIVSSVKNEGIFARFFQKLNNTKLETQESLGTEKKEN